MSRIAKTFATAALLAGAVSVSAPVVSAEPIVGSWRTKSGETARIAKCGGSFCVTLATGKYAGKRIGRMKGSGGSYSGTITDPTNDRKYSGSAKVSGSTLKMRGCALKVFCQTQNWRKL